MVDEQAEILKCRDEDRLHVLIMLATFKEVNPRDKVYAVLGMTSVITSNLQKSSRENNMNIEVKHSNSDSRVNQDLTKDLVNEAIVGNGPREGDLVICWPKNKIALIHPEAENPVGSLFCNSSESYEANKSTSADRLCIGGDARARQGEELAKARMGNELGRPPMARIGCMYLSLFPSTIHSSVAWSVGWFLIKS
jgi:hypothetical protein